MALIAGLLSSARAAPFKLPSLTSPYTSNPTLSYAFSPPKLSVPQWQTDLVSEHGQGGGYTPGDTGATPTPTEAKNGYDTNPDYDALLKGDTILSSGLTGLGLDYSGGLTGTGQSAALQAALANSRKAAVERFGGVPNFSTSAAATAGFNPTDIDETTRQLASSNTNSVLAQLTRQYGQAQDATTANLAARGMLRSGALGQHELENLSNYNQSNYDAGQQLLDYLSGLWGNYQTGLGGLQTQRSGLIDSALQRIIAQINANQIAAKAAAATTKQAAAPAAAAPSGGGGGGGGGGDDNSYQGWSNPDDILASLATEGVSAYSPDYVGNNYIEPQPITPTNFYTDVSSGAQGQTAAAVPKYTNAYNNPNTKANIH